MSFGEHRVSAIEYALRFFFAFVVFCFVTFTGLMWWHHWAPSSFIALTSLAVGVIAGIVAAFVGDRFWFRSKEILWAISPFS